MFLVDFDGAAPFGVQPHENAQGTDFYRARWHDTHLPHVIEVHGGDIYEPDGTAGRQKASQTLLGADAQQTSVPGFLLGGFRNLDDRDELGAAIDVPLAPRVPIDVVVAV